MLKPEDLPTIRLIHRADRLIILPTRIPNEITNRQISTVRFYYVSSLENGKMAYNKSGCLRSNITDFALSALPSSPRISISLWADVCLAFIFDVWLRSRKVIKYSFFLRQIYSATIWTGEKKNFYFVQCESALRY